MNWSNDLQSALENSIINFNTVNKSKTFYMSNYDVRNMFLQYLKKELKRTEYQASVDNLISFDNIKKVDIRKGKISGLLFQTTASHHNKSLEIINSLNDIVQTLNFSILEEKASYNNLKEYLYTTINAINYFKIK